MKPKKLSADSVVVRRVCEVNCAKCGNYAAEMDVTLSVAMATFVRAGWVEIAGVPVCPTCAKKENGE